jgi:DNA polymerase III subunit delta'
MRAEENHPQAVFSPHPFDWGLIMSWQHIRGHERQVTALQRTYRRGRLAHAYLLTGQGGIGKHTFAVELARGLLCEAHPPGADRVLDACDQCPACIQVGAGSHPDFFPAARPPESAEFPVALMHELCQAFSLKPARGRGKVVLIDGADDFNEESANCFLKTLEEPPPGSVFILVGTSVDRQLPTILSRCHVVRFGPLGDEAVATVLKQHDIQDPGHLQRLVRLADGSPGQALALADTDLWDFRKKLLEGMTHARIDSVSLTKSFVGFVEDAGKEASLQRRRASLVLRLLIEALTDALSLSQGARPKTADPDDLRLLNTLMNRASPEKFLTLLERCLETEQQIDRYVQVSLVLEALLDALAQLLEEGTSTMAAR